MKYLAIQVDGGGGYGGGGGKDVGGMCSTIYFCKT